MYAQNGTTSLRIKRIELEEELMYLYSKPSTDETAAAIDEVASEMLSIEGELEAREELAAQRRDLFLRNPGLR